MNSNSNTKKVLISIFLIISLILLAAVGILFTHTSQLERSGSSNKIARVTPHRFNDADSQSTSAPLSNKAKSNKEVARNNGGKISQGQKTAANEGRGRSESASNKRSKSKKVVESKPFDAKAREKLVASVPDDEKKYVVKLKSRALIPRKDLSVDFPQVKGDGEDTKRIYIQFEDIPSRQQRQQLAGLGVELEGYLTDNTYYASVMERTFEDLRRLSYVRGFANIAYADKISEGLYTGKVRDSAKNPDGSLSLKVTFDKDTSFEDASGVIAGLGGEVVSKSYLFGNRLVAKLDLNKVRPLAKREDVRRVDEMPPPIVAYNTRAANRSRADLARLHPNAAPGKSADTTTGLGVNVGIWDSGAVDAAHPEFQLSSGSRVTVIDNVPIIQHATHVAGTMGSAGIANVRSKGMAPGIFLFSWDFLGNVPAEMVSGAANQNIVMSNNSWGLSLSGQDPLFGNYTTDSQDMDQVVKSTGLITVFAAGNDRDDSITANPPGDGLLRVTDHDEDANYYDLIAPHQIAKNVITVGALRRSPSNPPFNHPRSVPPGYLSPDEFSTYSSGTITMGDSGTTTSTITVPESEGVNETNVYIIITVWAGSGANPSDLNRLRLESPPGPAWRRWELIGLMPGVGGTLVLSDEPGWPPTWIQSTMNGRFGTTSPNATGAVWWIGTPQGPSLEGPVNTLGTWVLTANDISAQGANQIGPPDTRIRFSWSITVEKSRTSFSSAGPADDGRIKPDVVADGYQLFSTDINNQYIRLNGTSMSAPTVTGGIALLTEAYKREHQGENPRADVIKALLIQTAHDVAIDRDTQILRQPLGPDYQTGYGEVDIDAALELIEDDAVNSVALTLPLPSPVGGGTMGFSNVTGLAFDPGTSTLYGVDIDTDQLITINTTTGVATPVGAPGTLGFNIINCLAFNSTNLKLYGVDIATDRLIEIDPATGIGSSLFGPGTLGFDNVAGLAFKGTTLYGVDITTDQLITINTTTGVGTAIGAGPGSIGFDSVSGLSFNSSGTLFGSDTDTDQLITINTTTGVGTAFGALGFNDVSGLAFDSSSVTLFGADNDSDRLIAINPVKSGETAPNGTTPTIITGTIEHGEIQEYNIVVDGTQGPVKVTLAWTDEPGDPNAVRAIVNNLDLELIEPDGVTVHFPFRLLASDPSGWLRAGTYAHAYIANILTNPTDVQRNIESNDVDNVEQVMYPRPGAIGPTNMPGAALGFTNAFDTPPGPDPDPTDPAFPTGRWTIRIRGTSIPTLTQDFALVSNYPTAPDDSVFVKQEFLDIPDNDPAGVTSIASFPVTDLNPVDGVADEAITINDNLTVFINISHPAPSELSVELMPPGGTSIPLGVTLSNGLTTINAGDPVLDPFDGVSTHNGLNGGWTLKVIDGTLGNVGTLESWGLKVGNTTIFANKANVIPDDTLNGVESVLNILDTDSEPGIQDIGITELDADVDIVHPLAQDLIITLISPAGTEVVLHNQTPNFGDPSFRRTTYDRLTIPAESLTAFNGEGVLGKWRLKVQDVGSDGTTPGITQYIRQWRLQVQGSTRHSPVITPVVPKADKTFVTPEDTQFTYDLTPHESDVEDSGSRLNWSIKGVDTSLFTASIDSNDLLTINPALNAFGTSQPLPATVPVEPLSAFQGQSMVGTWRLRIIDNDFGNDTGAVPGQLVDWQLILDDGTTFAPPSFARTPALPADIPDNDPVGGLISDIIIPNVPANDIPVQNTNDLNVLINITHGDVTDLQITLEHVETRTLIKLHDQTINFLPDNPATQPQNESRINLNTTYSDDVVTLTLTDSHGLTATQTVVVDIQPANDAPVISNLPDQTLTEDTPVDDAFNLLDYASDVETAPSQLTYSIAPPLPDPRLGVTLDPKATGVFVDFNPAPNFFSLTPIPVIIKVEDPDGASDTDTFDVIITPVNDPPQISPGVANFSYLEDEPDVAKRTIDLNNNEVDVDNDDSELDWSVTGVDTSLHTTNDPDPSTDLLIFTPVLNQNGTDKITLILTDKGGLQATQDITVTVIPVNDPPTIGGIPDISVGENTVTLSAFSTLFGQNLDDFASDVDNSNPQLTYTIVGNTNPNVGVTIDVVARDIDIKPVKDFFGFSDVTIEVKDPDGLTSTDTFRITVTDGPEFQVLPNITIPEDTICDDAFDLKDFASDGDTPDTNLFFSIIEQTIISPGNLTDVSECGVTIDPSNDNIDVNPAPDAYGACRVKVQVTDGTLSDEMTFDVTIVSVNDPPDINPLPTDVVTSEDTPFTTTLTSSETDVEDADTGLDWQVTGGNPALFNARIENIDNDELLITPLQDKSGVDGVDLTLRDQGPAALLSGQIDFTNPLTIVDSTGDPVNGNDLFTIDLNDGNGPQTVDLAPSVAQFRTDVLSFPLVFVEGVSDQFLLDVPGEGTGLVIDLAVGRSKAVGTIGAPFTDVTGLAFDPAGPTLYGVDNATDQLITIDTATGAGAAVGALVNFSDVNCLAFDPATSTLYGVDVTKDQLVTIEMTGPNAGRATGVGNPGDIGFNDVAGLAFDTTTSSLYGVDRDTDQLITIDTGLGVGTAVGAGPNTLGFDTVSGLSFDSSRTLFGSDTDTDQLITIDLTDGTGTTVGALGFADISGIAFNSTGTLFGADNATDTLITIDPAKDGVYNNINELINGNGTVAIGLEKAIDNALTAIPGNPNEVTVTDGGNNTILFSRDPVINAPGDNLVFNEGNGALRLLKIPQGTTATAGDVQLNDILETAARCEAAVNLAIPNPDEVIVLPDKSNDVLYFVRRTPGPAVITGNQIGFPLSIDDGVNDEFNLDLNDGFGPRPVDINDTGASMPFATIDLLALQVETAVDGVLTAAGIDPREVLVAPGSNDNLIVSRASVGAAVYRSGPLSFPLTVTNGSTDEFNIDLSRDGSNPVTVNLVGQTFTDLQDLVIEVERAVNEALTNAGLDPNEVTVVPEVGNAPGGGTTYQIAFKRATAGLGANIALTPGGNDALGVLNITPGVAGTNDIELTAGTNNALPSLGLASVARANDLVILDNAVNGALNSLNVTPGTAPGGAADSWHINVIINPINDSPTITDIPNVSFDEGGSDNSINLDDFITDIETPDDQIIWTVTGNTNVRVTIDPAAPRNVTIDTIDPDWNGQELITFIATDTGDGNSPPLQVSDDVLVTVNPINDPPTVTDIPDVTFDEGGSDNSINLDDYVSDVETADADIVWTVTESGGTSEISVVIDPGTRNVTISTVNPDFNGQKLLTFTATDRGDPDNVGTSPPISNFDTVLVTVNPVNDAPVVNIPDFDFPEGSVGSFDLDDFVNDVETDPADITWTFAPNPPVNITVAIDPVTHVVDFGVVSPTWNGQEVITFTATDRGDPDGVGTSPPLQTSDDVVISVTPVNSVPNVGDIPDVSFSEDGSDNSIDLDDYVDDPETADADIVWTFSVSANVNVAIDPVTHVVTFTGAPNFNGTETITFTATDTGDPPGNPQGASGQPQSASDNVTVTVTPVNDEPVVTLPDVNFLEDNSASFDLDDFITDVETPDASITWTYDPPQNIIVNIAPDHVVTFSAPANWNGTETVTFHATDTGDGASPAITVDDDVVVTVTPVNDLPVLAPPFPSVTFNEDETDSSIDLDDFVSDVETADADIVWTFSGNVNITVTIGADHVVTFGTLPDFNGTETITFTATDTGDGNDPPASVNGDIVVTVSAVNDPPTLSDIPDVTFPEDGGPATFNLDDFVDDKETSDDQITWTFTGNTNISVSIDANRIVTVSAPPNFNGIETITFTATDTGDPAGNPQGPDGMPKSVSDDVVVTVTPINDPPVVSDIPDVTFPEDSQATNIGLDGFVNDVETMDPEITWTTTGGTNVIVNIDPLTHVASISAVQDWNGSETITFIATDTGDPPGDPQGDPPLSASDTVVVTVTPVNDPPVVSFPDVNIPEDGGTQTFNLDNLVNDVETPDNEISWSFNGNVDIDVTIDPNNNVTFTIPENFNGTEVITFTATDTGDPAGTQAPPGDPGAALSTTDDVIFSVTPVNDPPVLVNIPDITFVENGSDSSIDLDNFVNDVETPDNEIVWTVAPMGTNILVSIDANNVVTFNATANWNGSEQVMFTATDTGDDGSPPLSTSDIVTVTVTPVNTPPVIDPPLPDVTFPEDGTGGPIALTATDIETAPEKMGWSVSGNNNVHVSIAGPIATFSAEPNWNGTETITFTATDGGDPDGIGTSPPLSVSDTITVTVTPVNDPPMIVGLPPVNFDEDSSSTLDLNNFVTDAETNPEDMTWQATGGTNITVAIDANTHQATFNATPNFNGSETITFTATDTGDGPSAPLSTSADVLVTVNAVNDNPAIFPPIPDITMFDGEQLVINLSNSETDQEDPPGPKLQWEAFGSPATLFTVNLTVDNFGNDILTINAVPDSQGAGTILLTLKDSDNATVNQTVTVEVISKFIELVSPENNSVLDPGIPPTISWRGRRIKKAFFVASSSNTFPKGKTTKKKRAKKNTTTFTLPKGTWKKMVKIARGNNNMLWARMSGQVENVKPRQTLTSTPFLYLIKPSTITLTGVSSEVVNSKSLMANGRQTSTINLPVFAWSSTGVEQFTILFSTNPEFRKGAETTLKHIRGSDATYTPDVKTLAKLIKIAEKSGGKLFWRVDGRDIGTGEEISSAVGQFTLTPSTALESAGFADANGNGIVDKGDTLTLRFTDKVEIDDLAKELRLGVEGDSFGDGATIIAGDSDDQAILVLGENPKLTVAGLFDPTATKEQESNQDSAISDNANASGIGYLPAQTGADATIVEPTYVDIVPMFVEEITSLSPEDSTDVAYSDIALGDVDGDGDLDLIVATDDGSLVIRLNDGNGNFSDQVTGRPDELNLSSVPALVDDNNDGHPEIIIPAGENEETNETGINLSDLGVDASSGVVVIDADGDGDLDVFAADYGGRSAIFVNDGNGVFYNDTEARLPNDEIDGSHPVSGDIDGDGDTDIVIMTPGAIDVLRNSSR